MNVKPIVYHWTKGENVHGIMNEGLHISGGVHMNGVYMTSDAAQYHGWTGKTHLFGIDLRGLEKHIVLMPDKKWVISEDAIPPENIFLVGGEFQSETELRSTVTNRKNEFLNSFHKTPYKLRTEKFRTYTPPQIQIN
ncbi:MAG: hypothetical protein ISS25_04920 [Nanoarchaeota archaeon]|nr:hypothetical protein [DPANN group archaeon]MBL7117143.1 hypothetical protein [Nanoarchaeota archaeon]